MFIRDEAGRLISATAGDLIQEWAYRYGRLSEHTRTDRSGTGAADVTLIGRDEEGRITGLTCSGAATHTGMTELADGVGHHHPHRRPG